MYILNLSLLNLKLHMLEDAMQKLKERVRKDQSHEE